MLWEAKYIFRDKAVFFSFVIVAVVVSFLYTYLYSEETLQKLPIGVVDEDNTAQSRQLLRMIDANSGVAIYSSYLNLSEAEKAFQREQIRGIVTIPNVLHATYNAGNNPPYQSTPMPRICSITSKYSLQRNSRLPTSMRAWK